MATIKYSSKRFTKKSNISHLAIHFAIVQKVTSTKFIKYLNLSIRAKNSFCKSILFNNSSNYICKNEQLKLLVM